ncbi:MAG: isoleucine--tRNA ligase [Chlamydiae bacterium RIFCSPHIGHO2_12_FULL_49_9]|nr:MAG: isoleucine--tRNA ligase [Chlamydiae bacterium RIFCSPHIGHO2_12_FULL_49_9]
MFEFDQDESFPAREERVLRVWEEKKIFQKSLEEGKGKPLFAFYDGPPFATGLPHYGHLLAGTIKDVVPRYKTMKGFYVPRRFGWDCHGLPVENEIEKAKELSGSSAIEEFGIAKFNEECRSIVLRYTAQWKRTVDRMARWVDIEGAYRTMDLKFMESVWWVFEQLYKKGLVYEGFKVMPFSTKLGTPLSNFEANLNYKEVDDPSLTVAFEALDEPKTFFLAWTTTPWTLPSNLALMAGAGIDYVKVERDGRFYILAEARLQANFKEDVKVVSRFKGKSLKDKRYKPLFPFFKEREAFRILLDDVVSTEDGTGIVHCAPAFGEADFFVCKREGIDVVCPVDHNGHFTKEVPPYAGMLVKDADKEIIRDLKKQGSIFHQGTIRHRYPFCWRSDTPLIYKAVRTWFVAVEKIKDKLLKANEEIRWVPGHIKEGRFGKWLENARDWAISRNRYWGTPIPLWRSDAGELVVIGSIKELEKLTGKKVRDLHRHHIDDLTFERGGEVFKRIPEVFDCWFESGSVPYAQNHYPFEKKKEFEKGFPADFIGEGLDQTRGWFYTLTVLAAALFDKPAFKNVIVNGIILAEDGNKMSKRLKNYPDPDLVIQKYGADAIRLYMLNSPAVKADDLRFSEKGVEHVLRQALIPFWNSFVFFSTYAKIYKWTPPQKIKKPTALIDRWLLSMAQKLISDVESAMDSYELSCAVEPFVGFIDQLTNWYIRRCRSRFWAGKDTADRREAFETLYTVLLELTKVAAPFVPFLSDAIYRELKIASMPESVHLTAFPEYQGNLRDEELEKEVAAAQAAVSLGHSLRKEHKLKVRQPLAKAHLITANSDLLHSLKKQSQLIADELNVKEVELHSDESKFVQWIAKPNFPILGKKIGKLMPQAQKIILGFDRKQLQRLSSGQTVKIVIEGIEIELEPQDVQIERKVKEGLAAGNEGELTVALDTALNDELLEEGLARELVNKINTMRRELGLEVTDRIAIRMQTTPRVEKCFAKYKSYIANDVLAVDVHFGKCEGTSWNLNGEETIISIEKALVST